MARTPKRTLYERRELLIEEIKETETKLAKLKSDIKELNSEIDNMEMRQLFDTMKKQGIDINEAMSLLKKEDE